ncbi:MAG: peptidoglycan DD-metalloendopeptidase family protein [Candidatus Rokubacteria bacterium]|nr:peptidoglycan DD-metalloendopeptidase family protein [Candidatus Rokubacteria bacterium]
MRALRPAAFGLLVLAGPMLASATGHQATASAGPSRVHEVKQGDTLGALAKRYGVTVAAIVAANRLPGPGVLLKLGQRLVIPRAASAAVAAAHVPPDGMPPAPRVPGGIVLSVPDFDDAPLEFAWPAEGPVTSTYGRRRSGWHRGIDIKAELGTPVLAAAPGVVIRSGVEPLYGRVLKIEHDQGFVTVYAHNDQNLVEAGDRVVAGETIATVGRTGRATTYHVHFEIKRDGKNYNPLYLLPLPPRIAQVDETDENPPDE